MPDIWMDVDTAVIVPVNIMPLIDDTDFKSIEIAIAYNSGGLAITWNFVTTAGVVTQTAITPTTGGSYDWSEPTADRGMYAIEIPASLGASANNDTEGFGWITGVATGVLPWRGPTIGFRRAALNDLFIDGGAASTNLEDFFDGTGYAGGTIKMEVGLVNDAITSDKFDESTAFPMPYAPNVTESGNIGIDWANVENADTEVELGETYLYSVMQPVYGYITGYNINSGGAQLLNRNSTIPAGVAGNKSFVDAAWDGYGDDWCKGYLLAVTTNTYRVYRVVSFSDSTDTITVDRAMVAADAEQNYLLIPDTGASAADVWAYETRELTALDEDNTTIDLDGSTVGTVTTLTNLPAITTDWLTAAGVKADAVTKIQAGLATPTNITAGTITTATNVTTVNGIANGAITAAAIATGAIDADAIAADAITAAKVAADVSVEIATQTNTTLSASHGAGAWGGAGGTGASECDITVNDGLNPLDGAEVWVTTDAAGSNTVASGVSDALGIVTVWLDAGTYYVWKQLAGYTFTNPETMAVT